MNTKSQARLCLGTVQFGTRYGINNRIGKPDRKAVFQLLDKALAVGIDCWDTAAAYGEAEIVLGEYLRERHLMDKVQIVSKLRPDFLDTIGEGISLVDALQLEIEGSLLRLGVTGLDGFLLHNASYLSRDDLGEALVVMKQRGLTRQLGVSVYKPEEAMAALKTEWVDAIQVPYNVLDRRLDQAGFFETNGDSRRSLTVYARSALLQGLIMMQENEIPSHLVGIIPHLRQLDRIFGKYGLDRFGGSVRFVMEHAGIDVLVFGVESAAQLEAYLKVREDHRDMRECWAECSSHFERLDCRLLSPNLWETLRREEGR